MIKMKINSKFLFLQWYYSWFIIKFLLALTCNQDSFLLSISRYPVVDEEVDQVVGYHQHQRNVKQHCVEFLDSIWL